MAVGAFVFDLGETLIDERRHWALVADAVGVAHERVWSALEDVAARGVHHWQLFDDLGVERPDVPVEWQPSDLYPEGLQRPNFLPTVALIEEWLDGDPGQV